MVELRPFQEFGNLRALAELHVGLLPVGPAARVAPLPLHLAVRDAGADAVHFRSQQLLDGAADLRLVGARRHVKHQRAAVLAEDRRLLGDQRAANDIREFHDRVSWSFSIAPLVATTRPASITDRAVSRALATSETPGMLRTDRDRFSSTATSTNTALPLTPSRFSSSAAAFVLTSGAVSSSTTTSSPACSLAASAARRA